MLETRLLQGENVRLTAATKSDLPVMVRWWSDATFLRNYDSLPAFPRTEEQLNKRIEEGQKGETTFLFAIRPVSGEDLIGLLELDGIIWSHGTTFLSIAIGDETHRGKGFGYEAMRLGLDFAFRELNLHRVCITVFSYNEPAIALYEKLGFSREGVYREHLQRDGKRHDMLLYGLLRREWESGAEKIEEE